MKIKTSEATTNQLNHLVARIEGVQWASWNREGWANDWAQGGPIIEREKIGVVTSPDDANVWIGSIFEPDWKFNQTGHTPLTAAMRCFVASKLGAEVDVPDELKGEKE